jgi:DNA-binding XRE family transcriptional regulator
MRTHQNRTVQQEIEPKIEAALKASRSPHLKVVKSKSSLKRRNDHDEAKMIELIMSRLLYITRHQCGLNQRRLADLLDIQQGTISKLEAGLLDMSAGKWLFYCRHVGIPSDLVFHPKCQWLLGDLDRKKVKTRIVKEYGMPTEGSPRKITEDKVIDTIDRISSDPRLPKDL